MKVKQNTSTKPSDADKVNAYIQKLKHPLVGVVEALRQIILSTDREIGEEITVYRKEKRQANGKAKTRA